MSRHPSFGSGAKKGKKRNVLKRYERVEIMKQKGQWEDRKKVTNLPKTRVT